MRHQVRREALAGVLALAAAALEVDLSDAVVILRNNATGALSAFSQGQLLLHVPPTMRHALLPAPTPGALPDAAPSCAWPCLDG
jgi:hypothetical protein